MKEEKKEKSDIKEIFHNLKKTYYFARKTKKNLVIFAILSIIMCILGAIIPYYSAQQLLKLSDGLWNQLIMASIFVLLFELLINVLHFFSRLNSQIFFRETLKAIQISMASEVMNIETSDLDKKSSGVFIDRMIKDTGKIADIYTEINAVIIDAITNIGILGAIFVINKWIFLYFIISISVLFIINKVRMHAFFERDKLFRKHAEITTGFIGELVRGVRDIKVLNAEDSFMNNVSKKITDLNEEKYKMSNTTRIYSYIADNLSDISEFGLIMLGIYLITIDKLSIASLVIIFTYRSKVSNLLYYVTRLIEALKDFNLSANRAYEIIDDNVFKKEKYGVKHIKTINGDIEFKNVTFNYDNDIKVLDKLSFKINANETVAFVGKSGAGKTTIFNLISKLYHAKSGQILIDNIDINKLDKDSIRGNISIITQNPYIFNMTIRENLNIVKSGLTEDKMIEACKLACFSDFVESLPDKYDTLIGEGGLSLSGGQKQRLAIARAFVQETEIILFDEATSALDNETQASIQEAINNLKKNYTILIIAHRLSSVVNADRILYLENGKICDSGNHKELLKKNKSYKKLYEMELKK